MQGWKKILCPIDFSDLSRAAMAEALEVAASTDGKVHLLHVVERPAGAYRGEGMSSTESLQVLTQQAQSGLARWQKEAEALLPGRVTGELVQGAAGAPAHEVARAAREGDFDVVVMGTHGRRGLRRLVLGSVSESVARSAPCPILLVRPKGRDG